jgi:hypothetical protein
MEPTNNKNLSQDQVKVILNNAPKGTDREKLIQGLVDRGYTLQGFNDQPVQKPKESSATFEATGDEGIISGTAKTIGNIPSSTTKLGKSVAEAVAHPVETARNIGSIVKGAGAKAAQVAVEASTDPASELHKRAEIGNEDTQKFDAVIGYFKDRYGGLDNLKKTVIEDPAGFAADISALFSGGGAIATKVGELSKIAEVSDLGNTLSKVGQATEPTTVLKKAINATKDSTVGKIASDVLPTSSKIINGQVVKALELTPGDLATIHKKTGNDPAQYIVDQKLLKSTPEETSQALADARDVKKAEVRSEVSKVANVYDDTVPQVTQAKQALKTMLGDLKDVPGRESDISEITGLIGKKEFNLSDLQRTKELMDDNFNIYSRAGDVRSSNLARGLDNIRGEIKSFIEDQVTSNTNGTVDIRKLNNEVQTNYALQEAIENRALRGQSRQYFTVFDGMLGTGAYATVGPYAALGLIVGKKLAESPTVRLLVARGLSKLKPSYIGNIVKEIQAGNLSEASRKTLQEIIDRAKSAAPYVESGSGVLNQDQEQTK